MKKRFCILLAMGIIGLNSIIPCCAVKAKSGNNEIKYSANSGFVKVSVLDETKYSTTLQIKNTSKRDIHDVSVSSKNDNRKLLLDSKKNIGLLKSGEKVKVKFYFLPTGKNSLQSKINEIGGVENCIPLGLYVISGISVAIYLVSKNKKSLEVAIVILSVGSMLGVCQEQREPIEAEVCMDIKSENGWNGTVSFTDTKVVVEESTKEVDIPFDILYELDNTKKVTEEPEVIDAGEMGKKTVTTSRVIVDGVVESEYTKEMITKQPKTQVQVQGTVEVIKKDVIPSKKIYVPTDTMLLGESEKNIALSGLQDKTGVSVTSYTWDDKNNKVIEKSHVEKEPSVEYWNTGTLKVEETVESANTEYVAVSDKEIGYTHVVREERKGSRKNYYRVEIDPKTGKEIPSDNKVFVKSEVVKPVAGKIEVGTLKRTVQEYPFKTVTKERNKYFDSYKKVLKKGKNRKVEYSEVYELNIKTGEVLMDSLISSKENKVIQKGNDEIVEVGGVTPNWVPFIDLQSEIKFNTVYVPCEDGSLSGDEQKVIQKGKNGRVYSEYLIACDWEGNELTSYERKLVEKDKVVEPIDAKIMVASNSSKLPESNDIGTMLSTNKVSREEKALFYIMCMYAVGVFCGLSYKLSKKGGKYGEEDCENK